MNAIVAMDPNRVIGNRGAIPWRLSDDLKFFKQKTIGCSLVMGRKTYDNVGSLPGRFTYVLTNDKEKLRLPREKSAMYVNYDVLMAFHLSDDVWVVGGAAVYEKLMPQVTDLFVTHLADEYDGDTFMPPFEHLFNDYEIVKETKDYSVVRYVK